MQDKAILLPVLTTFLAICPLAQTQQTDAPGEALKNPAAIALVERSLGVMGAGDAARVDLDSETRGVFTVNGKPTPIRILTKGSSRVRVEVQKPSGPGVYVLKNGVGRIRNADGKVRELFPWNTVAQRVTHIPALSLLAEFQKPLVNVGEPDKTPTFDASANADVVVLSLLSNSGMKEDEEAYRKHTRTRYWLDRQTGVVTKLEYVNVSENDPNQAHKVQVVYSDYRLIQGVQVPFRQETYFEGELESVLVLESVVFNTGVADSEFVLENGAKNEN